MRKNGRYWAVSVVAVALVAILTLGCSPGFQSGESVRGTVTEQAKVAEQVENSNNEGVGEHSGSGGRAGELSTGSEGAGEHGGSPEGAGEYSEGAGHAEGPGPGEESGQALALNDVDDEVRNGARLTMVYDPEASAFKGIVQNITSQSLCRVRVEVHLSNGTELGPTNPVDLPAGAALGGALPAAGETFDGWSAHAETSPCVGGEGVGEHGRGGEGYGEHGAGGEGFGEHGGRSEGAGEHGTFSD